MIFNAIIMFVAGLYTGTQMFAYLQGITSGHMATIKSIFAIAIAMFLILIP